MNLKNLIRFFEDNNCSNVYVKRLVKNNNSKQQIYVAQGDTKVLNIFPVSDFKPVLHKAAKKTTFHASCTFFWIDNEGKKYLAPHAKFILYPEYPEVRFSGFVQGCQNAPSSILNNPVDGRYLFFGITRNGEILGYISDANSEMSKEFESLRNIPMEGILYSLAIQSKKIIADTRTNLLYKLKDIHQKGWINSKQLKPGFVVAPCNESRCGGLTLEAELGIIQNGKSEPDYLGWEIKQFGVRKLHLINSARITLMTPEPDGGLYRDKGGIEFVRKYGYLSKSIPERMDFTGYHRCNVMQTKTSLRMQLSGFDFSTGKICNPEGGIQLADTKGNIAASWSFTKMLNHWNKKHAKAAYIPSLLNTDPIRRYQYSNNIILGEGTDFLFFIKSVANGKVVYDPGIHIDGISGKTTLKPRSQFRISSKEIKSLYSKVEVVDLKAVK